MVEDPGTLGPSGGIADRFLRWFRNWKLVSWRSLFLTLYVLYVLFGFFGVPPIVRNKAVQTLRERAGLEATIQKVRFNPFTLGLTIRGLSIADRPGSVLFSADEIYVNAESFFSLFRWAGTLKQLRVENPMVAVRRYADGKINLVEVMREVQRRSPPEPPDAKKELPRLYLQNIGINGAVVELTDAARPKPMTMKFGPSVLSLARISTIPDHQGTDEVTIQLPGAGTVRATGNVVVQPLGLEGDVTLEALQLKSLWPLMEPYFEFKVEGGVSSGKLHYAVSAPESGLRASIRGYENEVKDLLLVDQGEKIVEVARISLKEGSFQWPEAAVAAGLLRIEKPRLFFRREADGKMSVERMVPKKTREVAVETYEEVEKAAKWVVDLGKFEVVDSVGRFEDRTFTPPEAMEATNIQLAITGFTTRPGKQWTVVSSASFPKGATTKTNGKGSLGPPKFESDIELNGFDLSVPQRYVSMFVPIEPTGKAGTKGRLTGGIDPQKGPWVNFKGDAEVVTTAVKETVVGTTPVKWKAVKAGGIDVGYGPLGFGLKTLDIRGAVLEIVMTEKGAISITEVQKAMAKKAPGEKAPEPEPKPAAGAASEKIPIKIGTIRLRDCSGVFTDRRMKPAFVAALDKIEGTVQGIDSTSKTLTKIDIAGTVRGGGTVTLKSSLDVFEPFRATAFKLDVDKAEIPPMSPMSIYYVGHPITLGNSTIALDYKVNQKQLNGTNHLGTQDLTIGDKVEGQGKISLPIGLGISLLTDKEGRITLDFPVQADLNDPKLSIAKAAGAATSAVVSEIVKNPFRLLSGLGGGKGGGKGGDDLSFVEFAAGKSELEPASAERLKTLAAGLGARPQLKLVVAGVWDESVDGTALKEVALEKRIEQKAPGQAAAPSIATLESLYLESGGKAEAMAALRQSHTSGAEAGGKPALDEGAYEDELRKAILETQPVGPAEFQALGQARAASVQTAFGQAGLEAARLEMAAAHAATGSGGTRVRLPLEVAGGGSAAAPTKAAEKASAAPSSPR